MRRAAVIAVALAATACGGGGGASDSAGSTSTAAATAAKRQQAPPAGPAPRLTVSQPCDNAKGFTCSTLTVPLDRTGQVKGVLRLNVAAADNTDANFVQVRLLTSRKRSETNGAQNARNRSDCRAPRPGI